MPQSQNSPSHYVCDDNGEVKCLPGWQGDLCDVPICRRGCDPMNGYCKRPNECRCKIGFYGENCEKCIPLPGCQNGFCTKSFECTCKEGWDGLFCSERKYRFKPFQFISTNIKYFFSAICKSGCHQTRGYCEQPGECRCRLGWSGATCHGCQVLPGCIHGDCDKPLECKCQPGYRGLLCQSGNFKF